MRKKVLMGAIALMISGVLIAGQALGVSSNKQGHATDTFKANHSTGFVDVSESDWFYSSVCYVTDHEIMKGTSSSTFSPNLSTTRGMVVTMLWRLEGSQEIKDGPSFTDVGKEKYCYYATKWAAKNGIVNGYNAHVFGPNDIISREQLATILNRFIMFKNIDTTTTADINDYGDYEQVSGYAIESMKWAVGNKIITGTMQHTLNPKGNATRCQVAAIFSRLCENILTDGLVIPPTEEPQKETENENPVLPEKNPSDDSNVPDNDPRIKVEDASGRAGDIVEVQVSLKNNPGILGMLFSLEYDDSAMKLVRVDNGAAVKDHLTLTHSNNLESGIKFVWDGLEIKPEDIHDGAVLNLKFKLSNQVKAGESYELKLQYETGDIVDNDLNEVNLKIEQGVITIKPQ